LPRHKGVNRPSAPTIRSAQLISLHQSAIGRREEAATAVSDSEREVRETQAQANDRSVEEMARTLADRLRAMPNRQEMTDYAVSLLRESNEDADQAELARESKAKAQRGDPFNPIAFGIPLFVIGAVLMATGILAGPGLGVMGIAVLMVVYGIVVSLFSRGAKEGKKREGES